MRKFQKLLLIIMVLALGIGIISDLYGKENCYTMQVENREPVKVDVFLYTFNDVYISLVRKGLEDIENKNQGKVKFTFYDGKDNQEVQNKSINEILKQGEADLILLNLVDTKVTKATIDKIKEKNIPVILFNREPVDIDAVKSYYKSYFIGTDAKQAGILQGKIIINEWNSDKEYIDKNQDDVLQYIMLKGEEGNIEAIDRTKYSILTINNAGVRTEELALRVCNWNEEIAKNTMEKLFLQYGDKIEAIISNNDSMAIGALDILQKYGYNQGDKSKTIPIVGVDAIPEAQKLINEGFMTGSVIQDPTAMAEALYKVGMNLVYNKKPLDGTEYKFDDTGVAIRLEYKEYIRKNE